MKQNKYDDDRFFNKYSKMERSTNGLAGAGRMACFKKNVT
uniref:Methylase involved in ubiquinone/menaquinone biosynthesis n=1 Tax=Clostridioides difficile TaxID=1496 RepID=A0A381IB68_CLODI|nr:methylase involved in ubiquinone/menaquinone biosynthesis [Clostridioides difficile]